MLVIGENILRKSMCPSAAPNKLRRNANPRSSTVKSIFNMNVHMGMVLIQVFMNSTIVPELPTNSPSN